MAKTPFRVRPMPTRHPRGNYNILDGLRLIGVGPTKGYEMINEGRIIVTEIGGPGGPKRITDEEVARLRGETTPAAYRP
jgi:hypothetical protein